MSTRKFVRKSAHHVPPVKMVQTDRLSLSHLHQMQIEIQRDAVALAIKEVRSPKESEVRKD